MMTWWKTKPVHGRCGFFFGVAGKNMKNSLLLTDSSSPGVRWQSSWIKMKRCILTPLFLGWFERTDHRRGSHLFVGPMILLVFIRLAGRRNEPLPTFDSFAGWPDLLKTALFFFFFLAPSIWINLHPSDVTALSCVWKLINLLALLSRAPECRILQSRGPCQNAPEEKQCQKGPHVRLQLANQQTWAGRRAALSVH